MTYEIIVNAHPLEKRIALLENGKLTELLVEKKDNQDIVGNIYKGVIQDVLPGMGAAFVNIGISRTAFLHYTDLGVNYIESSENSSKVFFNRIRKSSEIDRVLRRNQEIVVQITKSPINKKGARLSGQISIPGKFLVYIPYQKKVAVSRKFQSNAEKIRVKKLAEEIKEDDVGLIIRTAALNKTKEEFVSEYNALKNTWRLMKKQIRYAKSPVCIYNENSIINTLIRDLFTDNVTRLIVDDKKVRDNLFAEMSVIQPSLASKIELYEEDSPIFDAYGIEREIESIFRSRVNLPSGGNIVIENTEALNSIDINTGSFTGKRNYEETITQTNIEAAIEIARQIRLRDLSGMIIIDFIDMKHEKDRNKVLDALKSEVKKDRAKTKVYPFTNLGLVEMTRKRTNSNIVYVSSQHCPYCHGVGRILSQDSVAMKIYRWLIRAEYFISKKNLIIKVHPILYNYLNNKKSYFSTISNKIDFQSDYELSPEDFRVLDVKSGNDLTNKYKA